MGDDYSTHPLWFLERLNIVDKHRHVTIKGVFLQGTSFEGGFPESFTWTTRTVSASAYGAELEIVSDDPTVEMGGHSTLQVVVDEPRDRIERRPLLGALEDALRMTTAVVADIERVCSRASS